MMKEIVPNGVAHAGAQAATVYGHNSFGRIAGTCKPRPMAYDGRSAQPENQKNRHWDRRRKNHEKSRPRECRVLPAGEIWMRSTPCSTREHAPPFHEDRPRPATHQKQPLPCCSKSLSLIHICRPGQFPQGCQFRAFTYNH